MIIFIRKRLLFVLFCGVILLGVILFPVGKRYIPAMQNVLTRTGQQVSVSPSQIVVIDPGHGGEDSGALSASGVGESGINLSISLRLRDFLEVVGVPTLLTRSEDIDLDNGESSIKARKSADLRRRVEIVNEQENPVLISIHQNSLPSSPVTHGAQVFWNRVSSAAELAELTQQVLNASVNIHNEKQAKEIPSSIYLMKHVNAPAILVECGFLSNRAETELLQDSSYQTQLAAAIAAGYFLYRSNLYADSDTYPDTGSHINTDTNTSISPNANA